MSVSEEEMRRYIIAFYGHNPELDNVPLRDLHFISKERFQYLLNGFAGVAQVDTNPNNMSRPLLAPVPAAVPQSVCAKPSEKITSLILRSSVKNKNRKRTTQAEVPNAGSTQSEPGGTQSPDCDLCKHQDVPQHIQYHAVEQMIASSMNSNRGLYVRFLKNPPRIDRFFSDIVPARIDSLFWDIKFSGNAYAFINFLHASDAAAFLSYFSVQKGFHTWIHVEWSTRIIPLERSIAEASITNGATRILRINEVPLDFKHTRIWNINASPTCGFRFVRLLRQDDKSLDYGLEFNSIGNAINARKRLSGHPKLTHCGFLWMDNSSDHFVAAFRSGDIKMDIDKNGPPSNSIDESVPKPGSKEK